jgi:hypothetical protein
MADRILTSLQVLATEKRGLADKERRLKQTERQLIDSLGRLLSNIGYRLVSSNGAPVKGLSTRVDGRSAPKRIHCPECDRRFGRPLHLARHMSAKHRSKPAVSAKRRSKPKRARKARTKAARKSK